MSPPCIVIDRGSSCTKLGFGGNLKPSFLSENSTSGGTLENPTDEDNLSRYFFSILRVDPEQHACIISEPSNTNPSARAECSEMLFETFNVPSLMLAPAPILALYGSSQQEVS